MTKRKKLQPMANQPKILPMEVSLLNLSFESYFPSRVRAIIEGSLGHSGIWIKEIKTTQEGNTFNIEIIREGSVGFGTPVPFHEQVSLDVASLSPGNYNVQVGDKTATFVIEANTIIVPAAVRPARDRPQPAGNVTAEREPRKSLMERARSLDLFDKKLYLKSDLILVPYSPSSETDQPDSDPPADRSDDLGSGVG